MKQCEYCGDEHDVRELCGARQAMSRRRFFSLSARAIIGVALAPQIIDAAQALIQPSLGKVGGIDRASFVFWRNQQVGSASALDVDALRHIYNECSIGVGHLPHIVIPSTAQQYQQYMGLRSRIDGDA